MKDKFLLPAALAGLLQAILLFLVMDLFYVYTIADPLDPWIDFFYGGRGRLIPCLCAIFFGGCYAAPMLLFTQKRNMLFYYLCSICFYLLFFSILFLIIYVLPQNVAHMRQEVADALDIKNPGIYFGFILLFLSLQYIIYAACAKLIAHFVFIGIRVIPWIRTRKNTHS